MPRPVDELFAIRTDFYTSEGMLPLCGTYILGENDRILAQFWLCNPRFEDEEVMQKVVDALVSAIIAKLSGIKVPEVVTDTFLDSSALAVVSYVTELIANSEKDSDRRSLIPAPLWAPQDVYEETTPGGGGWSWKDTD
jgi:hypothetical protein